MRLICPKCDAQYNVADDAIPKGGRDVQCSTCGHTWFQTEMSRVLSRPVSRVLSRPIPNAVKSEPIEPARQNSRDAGTFDVPHNQKEEKSHQPKHRPVDPTIANILREEAAREHAVPGGGIDAPPATQPAKATAPKVDLKATRERIAKMTEEQGGTRAGTAPAAKATAAAAAAAVHGNPRSVPDVNEINAVLRARQNNNANAELTEAERNEIQRRQGFRRGFFVVMGLFAVVVTPYVLADQIIENIPQSRETMVQYVAVVDQLRVAMNTTISGIRDSILALTGQT